MTYDTINDALTMAGGAEGALLAGRYRVVRQLGLGGMGSVWLAEDTQLDGKLFAIKMLPSILVSNKRAYRQLKDEALVAMKLTHPNIVTLRAFEENNGNPFLVMDYIDGETLDDYLAEVGNGEQGTGNGRAGAPRTPQGGLSESDVLRILKPIAAALDYAHSKGVVHRDVKLGNVMIAKDGTPYILDFGIAREIQETMTRVTGKLSSGTLLYMSPEQLNGDAPKKEQDIYSFAAMAYECLKGEPPFVRGNIEFQIMNKQPEPLVGRDDPIAPLAVGIMQGLAKKPEERPATCAAVLEVKGFSRVERAERVDGVGGAGAGGARRPAEPGTGNGRAGAPRPPVGSCVPRDRVGREVSPRPPKRNVAVVVFPIICVIAVLLVLVGLSWHRWQQRKQAEWRRIVAEQKAEEEARRQAESERKAREEADKRKAEAERMAQEAETRRRKEEQMRLAEASKAKASATEVRIEAKVQQGKVGRISDADGFKERKESLADMFNRADAFYDENVKRWDDAAALYKSYVEQSKELIALDERRKRAVEKKGEVKESFKKAEQAGAKTYARDSWNAAVKTWNVAAAEFRRMEFVSAAETFAKALNEFDGCLEEARNNRRIAEMKQAKKVRSFNSATIDGYPVDIDEGFAQLFNGYDLEGWEGATEMYGVDPAEPGVLQSFPDRRDKLQDSKRGDIYTAKEYRNFILRFEFMMPKNGNAGLGIRMEPGKDSAYYGMCELQLLDDGGPAYYDAAAKKDKLKPYQYTGSVYGIVPCLRDNEGKQIWGKDKNFTGGGSYVRRPGMWNFSEVKVVGSEIEFYLNGYLIMKADVSRFRGDGSDTPDGMAHPGLHNAHGRIGLLGCVHNVKWKNIRIKELPADISMYAVNQSRVSRHPAGFETYFDGGIDQIKTMWKGVTREDKFDNPIIRQSASQAKRAEMQRIADNAMRQHWSVRNGSLFHDGFKGGYSIATVRDYADFEMWADWRIMSSGADSGLFLRGSPQVQIWDAHQKGIGSGGLFNNKENPDKALKIADRPIGEWNRFHIVMKGCKVTVWLNGELVVDNVTMENYWDRRREIFPSEQIELQCHGDPIEWRNIYIKRL